MKLEVIQDQWYQDCLIDRTNLGEEVIKIASHHEKYYRIYVNEILLLKSMEEELKKLRLDKYEFYTMGPTELTPSDWELPARGKILKNEVQPYLDADKHITSKTLKVGLQKEKVLFCKSIIDSLVNRGFNLKAAIDYVRWQSGG